MSLHNSNFDYWIYCIFDMGLAVIKIGKKSHGKNVNAINQFVSINIY